MQTSKNTIRKRRSRKQLSVREKKEERNRKRKRSSPTVTGTNPRNNGSRFTKEMRSYVRETAVLNIFQFRCSSAKNSAFLNAVRDEMAALRDCIKNDLKNNIEALDPTHYFVCICCGHRVSESKKAVVTPIALQKYLDILQRKTYNSLRTATAQSLCMTCVITLKTGRTPHTALCKGWVFNCCIPSELSALTHHENLLISLRLPCVYTWRCQGGFGQFSSRGAPVSFSNPVAALETTLPRQATSVFSVLIERGIRIQISAERIRRALQWLISNNPLYACISLDEKALSDIEAIQQSMKASNRQSVTEKYVCAPNLHEVEQAVTTEALRGTQGPLDGEELFHRQQTDGFGTEDLDNNTFCTVLIGHILRPFKHRRKAMIPCYDAEKFLETYFPAFFPFGHGGPRTVNLSLAVWTKHALQVHKSRFATHLDFIFFVHAVLRRKRLSGLALHAPLRSVSTNAIIDIRALLQSDAPDHPIALRIEQLLRSGVLNDSFESLRGSPAFWSTMKRTAWAYLKRFGPCQLFITISVADVIDPYLFMEIDESLSFQDACDLSTKQRANLLATHPFVATALFHRRVQSLFDNFLFGETRPFGTITAYLGRVEQQKRKSPHLHLLIWHGRTAPSISDATSVAEFIELFCTAKLPPEALTRQGDIPPAIQEFPPPFYSKLQSRKTPLQMFVSGSLRHAALSMPYHQDVLDGTPVRQRQLRDQTIASQSHSCGPYCLRGGTKCRFFFPFPIQPRASLASRSKDPNDTRLLALAPRCQSYINSTHPMLTAMFRANTDVTVITGNSIAESMHVCSYAVKAEKNTLVDTKALHKLKNLGEGIQNDRRLLSSIARGAETVKIVGSQEAVDNLLCNPLIFSSAATLHVNTNFLL